MGQRGIHREEGRFAGWRLSVVLSGLFGSLFPHGVTSYDHLTVASFPKDCFERGGEIRLTLLQIRHRFAR